MLCYKKYCYLNNIFIFICTDVKTLFQVIVSGSRGYGYYRKPPPPSGKFVRMVHIIRNEKNITHCPCLSDTFMNNSNNVVYITFIIFSIVFIQCVYCTCIWYIQRSMRHQTLVVLWFVKNQDMLRDIMIISKTILNLSATFFIYLYITHV